MPNSNNHRSANRTQPQEEQAAGPSHSERKPSRDHRRKETFRKKKSEETSAMEKKAVYEHLYFGFNNMSDALSSLQVSVNPRTVIVPITTRGIGSIIRAIVARLTRLAIRQLEPVPLAAELYRITLLALEAKVGIAKEQTPATLSSWCYPRISQHRRKTPSSGNPFLKRSTCITALYCYGADL